MRAPSQSSPKVLIVAPDNEVDEEVERALSERGMHATLLQTGAQASSWLRDGEADLIVVRDPLPDMETIPWIVELRQAGYREPVIFRSQQSTSVATFERLTRELGVSLVLREPIVPVLFAEQVRSLLESLAPRADTSPPPSLAEEMAALRRDYARALPGTLEELARAIQLARERPSDLDRAREVETQAHSLKGAASTLGFEGVAAPAARIQQAAARLLHTSSESATSALTKIEEALAAALASLQPPT